MKHQKTIEQKVIKFIKTNNLLSDENKILIGLSGGADSVFALHFFKKYSKKFNLKICAIHVNHNLRGKESERDEKFCKKLCEKLNIDFFCSKVDVKSYVKTKKKSIEEGARILRYAEFERIAHQSESDLIVTAHNTDDNTETVLLNIFSGSGLKGISGIPLKRENIIRPFLCLSKVDIIEYLRMNKIKFIVDSSNNNLDYRRNYLRNKIIPNLKKHINPGLDNTVLNSSEVFRNQSQVIDYFMKSIICGIANLTDGNVTISISELKKYPDEVLGEIFKTILAENLLIGFSFNKFEKLKQLINSQVGTQVELGRKVIAKRERSKILISKKNAVFEFKQEIKLGDQIQIGELSIGVKKISKMIDKFNLDTNFEYISGDKLPQKLIIRTWEIGDKIQLLGMKGTKKISDVLTDLKIPSIERKSQLVLVNNNEIIWIVGKRISERYKVTEETKSIVKLWLN